MNDQPQEPFAEINRVEEHERQERQLNFQRCCDREAAIEAGRKVCPIGFIPAAMIILRFACLRGFSSLPVVFMGMMALWIVGYFAIWASAVSASYWFYNSGVSSRRATIFFMLLIETAFAGWLFLFYEQLLS